MSNQQPLLTPASLAFSLAPPRVPPHGSVLRKLYTHPNAARQHEALHKNQQLGHHDQNKDSDSDSSNNRGYQSHTLTSRLLQIFASSGHDKLFLHHPHLPTSLSFPDRLTRFIGTALPLDLQHSLRDGGYFRAMADNMVTLSCPMIGVGHISQAREFLELSHSLSNSSSGRRSESLLDCDLINNDDHKLPKPERKWRKKRIHYGEHAMQYFDLFLPSKNINSTGTQNNASVGTNSQHKRQSIRGTLFFIHGGAWGAGHPWMYRLVAPAFLKLNFAVVIVGYRTYPDASTIDEQCGDVRLAWDKCAHILSELVVPIEVGVSTGPENNGWIGNLIMGHSSGAHVGLLMLVGWIGEQMKSNNKAGKTSYPWAPDYFVGLSGPYDISYHFDFEGGRGVEQISPMKPICGHSRQEFDKASPVKRLLSLLCEEQSKSSSATIQQLMPPVLLLHGIEDDTVPFTATADAGRMLRSCGLKKCNEMYLDKTGHQEVIMHFMLGGVAKDLVLDWLSQCSYQCNDGARGQQEQHKIGNDVNQRIVQSRL